MTTTTSDLLRRRARSGAYRSVINQTHYDDATFGERLADRIAAGIGSWRFLIVQTLLVAAWVISNIWLLRRPFDPYPLILLNLLFSTQAAYTGPVVMMSQNRASQRDRAQADRIEKQGERIVAIDEKLDGHITAQSAELQALRTLLEQRINP